MPRKGRAWGNPNKWHCPECNSTDLTKYGFGRIDKKRAQKVVCKICLFVTVYPNKGREA